MASLNKVMLIGHLGKDPEIRYTADNVPIANFTMATSENYTNKSGEKVEQTEWHNIVAFRNLADLVQKYLHKGKQIYLEGKIRTRTYDDKDGVRKYFTEIMADNFLMLGRREENEPTGSSNYQASSSDNRQTAADNQQTATASTPQVPADDDLPF